MSQGGTIDLNIGPNGRSTNKGDILFSQKDNPPGYTSYEYTPKPGAKQFKLNSVSYNEHKLAFIVSEPVQNVTKVTAYFTNTDTILAVHVIAEAKNYFYTNHNTDQRIESNSLFEEFLTKTSEPLDDQNIKTILENIVVAKKLNYGDLPDGVKNKLWRLSDIMFDFSQKSSGNPEKPTKYHSDVSNAEVTVVPWAKLGDIYPTLQHYPQEPYYIKGLKNGQENVAVGGGFPGGELAGFNVYYGKGDGTYEKPLLITLNPKNLYGRQGIGYIPGMCFIFKNDRYQWDILKTTGSKINNNDLKAIVEHIEIKGRLIISDLDESVKNKLKDFTKNLVINLKEKFDQGDGAYTSGGISITYTKTDSKQDYATVRHASKFPNFTVKIVTTFGEITSADLLPPKSALIRNLSVFYNGKTTTDPLLIFFLYTSGQTKWLQRHNGDTTWAILTEKAPADEKDVKALLDKLAIPNVTIDFSQTRNPYTPPGTFLSFTIANVTVPDSNYHGLKYSGPGATGFTVKSVTHSQTPLTGIKSEDLLDSISAFYYGSSSNSEDRLVMVELEEKQATSSNCLYFKRESDSTFNWAQDGVKVEKLVSTTLAGKLVEVGAAISSYLSKDDGEQGNMGMIIGIAIAGGLVVACIIGLVVWKLSSGLRTKC